MAEDGMEKGLREEEEPQQKPSRPQKKGYFGFKHPRNEKAAIRLLQLRVMVVVFALSNIMVSFLVSVQVSDVLQEWEGKSTWVNLKPTEENAAVCQKARMVETCPSGWTMSSDATKCLRLYADRMTFEKAQATCDSADGTLMCIRSAAQNEDAKALCGDRSPCWIGLTRSGGAWKWLDFTPVRYTHWHDESPSRDEAESAVGLGLDRLAEDYVKPLDSAGGGHLVGTVVFIGVVLMVAMCTLYALKKRDTGMMTVTVVADVCGACGCCLFSIGGIVTLSVFTGVGAAFIMVSSVLFSCFLCGVACRGLVMRGHMIDEEWVAAHEVSLKAPVEAWVEPVQPTSLEDGEPTKDSEGKEGNDQPENFKA